MPIFRDFRLFERSKLKFCFSSKNIPVCETRVMREKVGMPWNNRIAIHPLPDGKIEMKRVEAPKIED